MLATINNLGEIRERCHNGEPLDPSLPRWMAERLDRFPAPEWGSIGDCKKLLLGPSITGCAKSDPIRRGRGFMSNMPDRLFENGAIKSNN